MTLSKDNYLGCYYRWITGDYPRDLCSFFWGSLFFIVFSPFLVLGKKIVGTFQYPNHNWGIHIMVGLAFSGIGFFITILGNNFLEVWFGYVFIYCWSQLFGGFF